jgi:hypothetical protein
LRRWWTAASAPAQFDLSRVYSQPCLPPREILDRLNLEVAWSVNVPTDGRRDGLYTVQIAPHGNGHQLFVQTRSGLLVAIDAATGRVTWSSQLGLPYRPSQPVAYNAESVFAINNIELFSLERNTGRLQWQYTLGTGASSPPAANTDRIYLSLAGRGLTAYLLPHLLEKAPGKPGEKPGDKPSTEAPPQAVADILSLGALARYRTLQRTVPKGPQPVPLFSFAPASRVELAPLVTADRLLIPEAEGLIVGLPLTVPRAAWEVATRGPIRVPPGQNANVGYVASGDMNVYAIHIPSGRALWRFPAGAPVKYSPAALLDEVYVTAVRAGLSRVDRATGLEVWRNEEADRFLAANPKFTYAMDRSGRLMVLDRARGTRLSIEDGSRDFFFPVANDWTDRIFLAANNGLILCLHDRDYASPVPMKTGKEEKPPKPGGKPGEGDGKGAP